MYFTGCLFTRTIFHVVIENRSVTALHTFDGAVIVMFALHYILNLEYLSTCTANLEFLQRAYMGINPVKGSKNKKKQGKKYQVHPKVLQLQLVNELKMFEKRCKC
ncbi:hypothetical protein SNE40_013370 [Patella caerulea]|uniref:Uncharacterized protein n=1 Tax=Patella caerulea TaxID=87958 RepID=A0AAN8PNE3_PATCE